MVEKEDYPCNGYLKQISIRATSETEKGQMIANVI
jgi:hypothetical protein